MMKRTYVVLSVAVLAVAVFSLLSGGKSMKLSDPSGSNRRSEAARGRDHASTGVGESAEQVPRSRRHADGALEKHREGMRRLMELDRAVEEQETELEKKRREIAAIIRMKQMMFLKNDPRYVPPSEIPAGTGSSAAEGQGGQEAMSEEVIRERSRSKTGYADAKREFETEQNLLHDMRLKRNVERQRLQDEEK